MSFFAKHLEIRKNSLEAFVAVLREEQSLFSASQLDDDGIINLTKRKVEIAEKVSAEHEQTNQGLRKMGLPVGQESVAKLAAQEQCSELWDEINQLAHQAKLLNEVNGTLIQMRWEPTKKMLDFLQKASGTPLYGPNGKAQRRSLGGVSAQA